MINSIPTGVLVERYGQFLSLKDALEHQDLTEDQVISVLQQVNSYKQQNWKDAS